MRTVFVFVWWLALLAPASAAQPAVTIAAINLPGLIQPDQQGSYDRLLARASAIAGWPWQFRLLPPKRAALALSKETGCAFGFDLQHFNDISEPAKSRLISAEPFNRAKVFLFSTFANQFSDVIYVQGYRLGARLGVNYGAEFERFLAEHPEQVEFVPTDEGNIEKWRLRRIDGFLAYFPNMNGYYRQHAGTTALQYAANSPLITYHDGVVCPDTPLNAVFIRELNSALAQLTRTGEVKDILGQYYVAP
jgi:ABC-type amino acid transport substrate-binding protein